ncbi:MAG TPA: hypothetical protein VFU22_31090, partial [Roseiflexaceae bacterium]|nr:hypothetical protein [Roseiflexaceae bacterium]
MARQTSLPASASLPAADLLATAERFARRSASDRARLAVILLIALCQGALYLFLQPPWQHYDEPTHFEYAWLLANRPGFPRMGGEDPAMRRDVLASMIQHGFYRNGPPPPLLTDGPIEIGVTELLHPPAYYLLVSLPLRLVAHLDITSQLYLARGVSMLLLVLTIAVAAALVRDLTPYGHALRWAVPLAITLIPPFVDLMTAVNNEVGAVAVFSLFLWGAVRAIRLGLSWPRLAWVFGTALLAAWTKNTAAIAIPLALLACVVAFWVQRGWRWRWLAAGALGGGIALLLLLFSWGDAAYWYHGANDVGQTIGTRADGAMPLGSQSIVLEALPGGSRQLLNPLLGEQVQRAAGRTVTVGGWVWTDQPGMGGQIGLTLKTPEMAWAESSARPLQLTTQPTFMAWTFEVPPETFLLQYMIEAGAPAEAATPAHLYLDGALIVEGSYPTDQAPAFDDAAASGGEWGGQRFTNLLRNGSGERGWPRLRPWLDQALVKYIHRSPTQSVATLFDPKRIAEVFVPYMLQPAADTFIESFAWSNVKLSNPIWRYLERYLAMLALIGCIRWLVVRRDAERAALLPALLFLALVGVLVWINTIFRPLPLLGEMYVVPVARYTFPAIIVTVLAVAGGWWALWPHKLRLGGQLVLIAGLLALNGAAITTI